MIVYLHAGSDLDEFTMLPNVSRKPILGTFLEELLHLLAVKVGFLVLLLLFF